MRPTVHVAAQALCKQPTHESLSSHLQRQHKRSSDIWPAAKHRHPIELLPLAAGNYQTLTWEVMVTPPSYDCMRHLALAVAPKGTQHAHEEAPLKTHEIRSRPSRAKRNQRNQKPIQTPGRKAVAGCARVSTRKVSQECAPMHAVRCAEAQSSKVHKIWAPSQERMAHK
jgi:hypothetical protein